MTKFHIFLWERGISPKIHVMDNECPEVVKEYLRNNKAEIQIVFPHMHRTNAA